MVPALAGTSQGSSQTALKISPVPALAPLPFSQPLSPPTHLAEEYSRGEVCKLAILDHARFADAFMRLKAGQEKIREGSFVFRVKNETLGIDINVRVFASRDGAGTEETRDDSALAMTGVQTEKFLACPLEAFVRLAIRESEFCGTRCPCPSFAKMRTACSASSMRRAEPCIATGYFC